MGGVIIREVIIGEVIIPLHSVENALLAASILRHQNEVNEPYLKS
jgi:hypothetical protein